MCGKNALRTIWAGSRTVLMNRKERQDTTECVESLFDCYESKTPSFLLETLKQLGFVEKGADPAFLILVHPELELYLDIGLDANGKIHGYELLPFEEMREKQRKFRW